MKLYEYKYAINVVPGRNPEEAADHYYSETEIQCSGEKDFELLVPHEDFIKLFRLARTLDQQPQYTAEDIIALVDAYAKKLGYTLTESDIWHGIVKWSERLSDSDDEDIEDWLI